MPGTGVWYSTRTRVKLLLIQLIRVQRVMPPVPGEPPTRPRRRLLGERNIHVPQKLTNRGLQGQAKLVYRLLNPLGFVAFKMGRRQGGPSRTGGRGRISKAIRNRRATQPPAHFQRNPPGRGHLAVFPRCSLLTYQFRYARRSRLEKLPRAAAPPIEWPKTASWSRPSFQLLSSQSLCRAFSEFSRMVSGLGLPSQKP